MIEKESLSHIVEAVLDAEEEFLVSLSISAANDIKVLIDSTRGVAIDRCVAVSRAIESHLDRDVEDFSIEVSSAGLGDPFLHPRQYLKHIGSPVRVVLKSGQRIDGHLEAVGESDFTLSTEKIIPAYTDEAGKRHKKSTTLEQQTLLYEEVKSTSYRF